MKSQRPLTTLLLLFAATICFSSVSAQDEVKPAKSQEDEQSEAIHDPFSATSNSDSFESILKQLFPTHKLEIVPIRETAVFIRGTVETDAEVQQIEDIAGEFWPIVHNYAQAKQPEMQAVYSDNKSEGIPNGMRVITVPVIEWVQNPSGPDFNKIVSLYSTTGTQSSLPQHGDLTGNKKLLAHNLMVFAHSGLKRSGPSFNVSLLVQPEQVDPIKLVDQQGGKLILVSQVVTIANLWTAHTPPNLKGDFLSSEGNSPQTPPANSPVPYNLYAPVPDATPTYPGVPQPVQPIPPTTPRPSDSSRVPAYDVPPALLEPYHPLQQSSAESKNTPPANKQQIDFPVPHSFEVPEPSSEFSPFQPNATPTPANSLHGDVRALHSDVKKLIELLEKRQANQKKQPALEDSAQLIPKQGKAVLFFHAAWGGEPCNKMKPIIQKLQDEGMKIVSVDINGLPELSRKYDIKNIPTFQLIEDTKAVPNGQISGVKSEQELRRYILDFEGPHRTQKAAPFSFLSDTLKVIQITVQNSVDASELTSKEIHRPVTGNGLLIQQTKGKAIVLTTAQLFRGRKIGSETPTLLCRRVDETPLYLPENAKLIAADTDADLALIEISLPDPPFQLKPVPFSSTLLKKGSDVFFVGYPANQNDLTRKTGLIGSVDKFAGPSNFQISKTIATNGMSGSPVFDQTGGLCGIVIAVDPQGKETVCTSAKEIKRFLKEANIEVWTVAETEPLVDNELRAFSTN